MDAIKKKMQAMKMEKDAAMDKADTCEGQAKDANQRADKVLSLSSRGCKNPFDFTHRNLYMSTGQRRGAGAGQEA